MSRPGNKNAALKQADARCLLHRTRVRGGPTAERTTDSPSERDRALQLAAWKVGCPRRAQVRGGESRFAPRKGELVCRYFRIARAQGEERIRLSEQAMLVE